MSKRKIKKRTLRNLFTLAVVLVIIIVAVACYISKTSEDDEKHLTTVKDVFSGVTEAETDTLKVHFIDIGQGDCVFIQFPDGKNMLMDTGKYTYNGTNMYDHIKEYLDELMVKDLTVVLATHSDQDHIGSMKSVFRDYDVGYCLRPFIYYSGEYSGSFSDEFNMRSLAKRKKACSTKTYYYFLDSLLKEKCGYEFFNKDSDFTQKFTYNGVESSYTVDFLTPTASVPDIGYSDLNDYSPIMTLEYCGFTFMFTGDAEATAENEYLDYYGKNGNSYKDVDVLKAGHHGSRSSSTKGFVNAVKPEFAVIMCGQGNSYGHPASETLNTFIDFGANIYRTDLQGDIVFEISGEGMIKNITTVREATTEQLHTPAQKQ